MAGIYKYGSAFRDECCSMLDRFKRGSRTPRDREIAEYVKSLFLRSTIGLPPPADETRLQKVREREAKKQAETELQAREQSIKLTPYGPIRPEIKLTPFGPVKPITPPPVDTEIPPVTEPCIKLTPFGPIKPVIPPPVEKAVIPTPVETETPYAEELSITLTPFGPVKPIVPPLVEKPYSIQHHQKYPKYHN